MSLKVLSIFRIKFIAALILALLATNISVLNGAAQQNVSPMHILSTTTDRGELSWKIELASDNESRSVGLMNRKSMPKATGMLFRFDETQQVSMWMKNTFISLDMVFLDERGKVSHIHRAAVPQSLSIISSGGPARYVLEINAGEADASALKVGTRFRHPWFATE